MTVESSIDCDTTSLHKVLLKAFSELARIHQANCYHGRPALRDILINSDKQLTFIDLEESGIDGNASLMARDIFIANGCESVSANNGRATAGLSTALAQACAYSGGTSVAAGV